MAWNEPGGEKRNPWNRPQQSQNDLDEVLRNLQRRIGALFGRGGGSGGGGQGSGNFGRGLGTVLTLIGVVWLGEANAVPVTALLRKTRSTIDDFVATIDTIRGLHLEGQDPASVQAMAREMHQQAAERLCGA